MGISIGLDKMKKLLIGLILMGLMVASVNAWTIDDSKGRVTGYVEFYGDGSGIVNVSGHPIINFTWYQSGDMIRANYLFYGVNIYYNVTTDELWSPDVEGVTLKR